MSPQPRDGPHPSTEPTRPARPALQAAFSARARCSLLLAALLRSLLRRDRARYGHEDPIGHPRDRQGPKPVALILARRVVCRD